MMSVFLNKTIRLFLDSIGRREEYEYYLERFSADRPKAFAILVPELSGFEDLSSVFAFDMRFLLRLGLDPVVLLCGAEAETLSTLLQVEDHPFAMHRVRLAEGIHHADPLMERLDQARTEEKVLVLADPDITLEPGLAALVPALSRRLHFIRVRGPLHDLQGKPLFFYALRSAGALPLPPEDEALVQMAARLLEREHGLHISVASPLQLLEELFTVKGAGCLIRRGSLIRHIRRLADVDAVRLISLLESSFGRPLANRHCLAAASDIYIDEQYKGAAILEPHQSVMYLSKFAVQAEARGEGLAVELWQAVLRDHPSLFWRASPRNPINQWYDRQADGSHLEAGWKIYWRGLEATQLPEVIASAIGRPVDFVPNGVS